MIKKKIISLLLIIGICIALIPVNVFAGVTDNAGEGTYNKVKVVKTFESKIDITLNEVDEQGGIVKTVYTKNETYIVDFASPEGQNIFNSILAELNAEINNYNELVSRNETDDIYYTSRNVIDTNSGQALIVGNIDDLVHAYVASGNVSETLDVTKHELFQVVATVRDPKSTSEPVTQNKIIDGANVTLTAPKVGDEVKKITKNDGYGDYETQDVNPTVSTTTEGIEVSAYYVKGLEDLSNESFYGTFESNKDYYVMIDFEAKEGYELPSTFPDGIRVNGQKPAEVFAVLGGKYNHCIVKVKATEKIENVEYKILEGANQTYESGKDLVIRASGDFTKFIGIVIDETPIPMENYSAVSGSTIITLKSTFLDTLTVGSHTMKIIYNDGYVSTNFTIAKKIDEPVTTPEQNDIPTESNKEEKPTSPQTGDNLMTYVILLVVSVLGISIIIRKKLIFVKKK